MILEHFPVNVSAFKKLFVEDICAGKICKEHTDGDGEKKQGLKFLMYSKPAKEAGYGYHNKVFPTLLNGKEPVNTGIF